MESHKTRVKTIAEKVKYFHDLQIPWRIYHGATNSTRLIQKDADKVVDTSMLTNVISIDKENLTAIVEPNVAMDALVDHLLPTGVIPKVVPEFPGITVGGSYSGTAAESSSFKEGYFDRIVNWVETVLADGRIIRASPSENPDLFYGAAGALGTLGVVTLLEIQLMRSEPFVELTYIPTTSVSDTLLKLAEAGRQATTSFLDAVLYTSLSGIILQGRLSSETPSSAKPLARFSRASDPWFFLHAHTKLKHWGPSHSTCRTCSVISPSQRISHTSDVLVELIPIKDYLFRYDRGAFWMGSYGWDAMPLPFNNLGRLVLNPLFRTRMMYSIMHHSGQSQRFVVQDLAIPPENAEGFINFCADELRIWPLWICPITGGSKVPMHEAKSHHPPTPAEETLINVGVWGLPHTHLSEPIYYGRTTFPSFILLNRMIEDKVRKFNGLKWLYAHNYMTEEEFWKSYDKERYDGLRKQWGAEGLPSIWDKIGNKEHAWQSKSILKGFWRGWVGRDYLLRRK